MQTTVTFSGIATYPRFGTGDGPEHERTPQQIAAAEAAKWDHLSPENIAARRRRQRWANWWQGIVETVKSWFDDDDDSGGGPGGGGRKRQLAYATAPARSSDRPQRREWLG